MVAKGHEAGQGDIPLPNHEIHVLIEPTTNARTDNSQIAANSYGAAVTISNDNDKSKMPTSKEDCFKKENETYLGLLRTNRAYRLYLFSYLVTLLGEWFTYVACLSFIASIYPGSYTAISFLVVVRLTPYLLFSMFGGSLADARDRRISMITLDCISTVVALMFLIVLKIKSLLLLYFLVFLQQSIGGLYEPVRSAIIPMLVPDEEGMKKATTLTTMAWSLMAAFGAGIGGVFAGMLGMEACFIVDGLTFFISAILMWQVGGTWNPVEQTNHEKITLSYLWNKSVSMTSDGIKYLRSSFFGPLVFIKASGATIFGASDIVNVAFSEREVNEAESLGILFASVGIGCILGPLIADPLTDMKKPSTLQIACIAAFALMSVGCFGLGYFIPFWTKCLFTMVRSAGAAIMWTDSSLLLQKFCVNDMLGRVSAVDFGFATLSEATSAVMGGFLQDQFGLSAEGVSYAMSYIALVMVVAWTIFHRRGGGASGWCRNENDDEDSCEIEMEPEEKASLSESSLLLSQKEST